MKTWVTASSRVGGTQGASGQSIIFQGREIPTWREYKNLDIGATLDGRSVVKSKTPLSTFVFVFKEEEWLNWVGRSPWLTSFSL